MTGVIRVIRVMIRVRIGVRSRVIRGFRGTITTGRATVRAGIGVVTVRAGIGGSGSDVTVRLEDIGYCS